MPDRGPLAGIRIVEMVGIGPAPFAAMILADLGAEIIRIDRPVPSGLGIQRPTRFDLTARGRQVLTLDLKRPEAVACALDIIEKSDALIEGFRPGVMERVGLGPDICLERNPRLVFGRLTGWATVVPVSAVFIAVGFSAGVGVFFGYYPAGKARALNPIQALRYE